ncbi:hypothetical protein Tco_0877823 [Tanacetum coccineum]|uniref:Uncharacterized protein n=1 Tax=Tanacetum coccineum TaxID=301880 RepID=A0ABQ5BYN5_9ASTR
MPRTMRGNVDKAASSRSKRSRQTMEELREAGSNEEIFTSVAWIRAFNINEPIYSKLFHEFYSTYEFDKLTLLEIARRLGLYHAKELDEKGFDVYFQGGLRSDEHFNAQESVERRT